MQPVGDFGGSRDEEIFVRRTGAESKFEQHSKEGVQLASHRRPNVLQRDVDQVGIQAVPAFYDIENYELDEVLREAEHREIAACSPRSCLLPIQDRSNCATGQNDDATLCTQKIPASTLLRLCCRQGLGKTNGRRQGGVLLSVHDQSHKRLSIAFPLLFLVPLDEEGGHRLIRWRRSEELLYRFHDRLDQRPRWTERRTADRVDCCSTNPRKKVTNPIVEPLIRQNVTSFHDCRRTTETDLEPHLV